MLDDYVKEYQRFWQDLELARHYSHFYVLVSGSAPLIKNPILEQIIPSLLYIRMVSFFDDGLILYIDSNDLSMPKKHKPDLHGRINFLNEIGKIKTADECHRIRDQRNSLSHETSTGVTWEDIISDVPILEEELRNLGLIGQRPPYEFYGEASKMRNSDKPGIIAERNYSFGLKENNQKRIEISFTTQLHKDS